MAEATTLKDEVVDLKEQVKALKKCHATSDQIEAHQQAIAEKAKAARDLEAKAAAIDAAVFDLKATNPNAVVQTDDRGTLEIIQNIGAQGRIVTEALARLEALLAADAVANSD